MCQAMHSALSQGLSYGCDKLCHTSRCSPQLPPPPPAVRGVQARLAVLLLASYTLPVNQLSNSWYASLGLKAGTMWPAPRTVQNDMPSYSVQ